MSLDNVSSISIVDAKIENLEAEIRKLKTHRNTLVEIGQLPSEILREIFLHCQGDLFEACSDWRVPMDWLPETTHVCRRWRASVAGTDNLHSPYLQNPRTLR